MTATFSIETSRQASGAIAIVRIKGADLDAELERLGFGSVGVGEVRLRDLLGVDRGVIARWNENAADLCVHGGRGVVSTLCARLRSFGIAEQDPGLRDAWPEAADEIEARMLDALARAASPRAVEVLLAQPARWRKGRKQDGLADGSTLRHLLDPALVVIWGPPNVGKSTLLNTLACETVGLASDMPGTTRDAVGACVVVDGLMVRMIDAPGVAADESDAVVAEAVELARSFVSSADLVLCCSDGVQEPPAVDGPHLRVALRADVGRAGWRTDVSVSAHTGEGLAEFARLLRQRLVPDEVLHDARPWMFWQHAPGGSGGSGCHIASSDRAENQGRRSSPSG